ncbi:MAG: helix-turn-helix transcriptional regulator [Clostridiales bacterium]|nr:helix-turn-helix transcriptional regulator [Clostridiales bacterium]
MSKFLDELDKIGEEKFGKEIYEKAKNEARVNLEIMEFLTERRKSLNISQEEMGRLLKTTQEQISKYENLNNSPSLERFMKILDSLNIDLIFVDRDKKKELYHT